jgi:molecular chaperone DnaK
MPQIEVKFDLDQNGILNVSARDLGTKKEASVRIEQTAGLSDDEIQRMRRDAEGHAAEDKQRLDLATHRNQADQLCYQLEKLMKEHEDKLRDADKEPLTKAIEKTRSVAKGDDADAIKSAINELEQASQAFSKVLYERAQAETPPAGSDEPAAKSGDEDAIDAEFEVKKD